MLETTHDITLDTAREDGKQHILNYLFGAGFGREFPGIIKALTGVRGGRFCYLSKDEKKLSSRIRGWLRQLEADGKVNNTAFGYRNVT